MSVNGRRVACATFLLALPLGLRADTLHLRDGSRVQGELISVRNGTIEFEERRGSGSVRTLATSGVAATVALVDLVRRAGLAAGVSGSSSGLALKTADGVEGSAVIEGASRDSPFGALRAISARSISSSSGGTSDHGSAERGSPENWRVSWRGGRS